MFVAYSTSAPMVAGAVGTVAGLDVTVTSVVALAHVLV